MDIGNAINAMLKRTEQVFSKELSAVSGCLILYPKYFLLMMEGPEISLADFFTQYYASSLMKRINAGCVLFIMPHVHVRYLMSWTVYTVPGNEEKADMGDGSPHEALSMLGLRTRSLWRFLHSHPRTKAIPQKELPEENLLEFAVNTRFLRPFHIWVQEIVNITFNPMDKIWLEEEEQIPQSFLQDEKESDLLIDEDLLAQGDPKLDKFIRGDKMKTTRIGRDGEVTENSSDEESKVKKNLKDIKPQSRERPLTSKVDSVVKRPLIRRAVSTTKPPNTRSKLTTTTFNLDKKAAVTRSSDAPIKVPNKNAPTKDTAGAKQTPLNKGRSSPVLINRGSSPEVTTKKGTVQRGFSPDKQLTNTDKSKKVTISADARRGTSPDTTKRVPSPSTLKRGSSPELPKRGTSPSIEKEKSSSVTASEKSPFPPIKESIVNTALLSKKTPGKGKDLAKKPFK